jgi:oligoendopeptidase F
MTIETIKTEWDLEKHYFSSINDPRINQGIEEDNKQLDDFIAKYEGKIAGLSDDEFLQFLNDSDDLNKNTLKAHYYFSYLNTLNTQDQDVLKKMGELQNTWAEVSSKTLFITEELKEVGYDKLMQRSELPSYEPIKNYMISLANDLKFTLSKPEEKVSIELGKVTSILDDIYTELTNSFEFEVNGEHKTKSQVYADRMSQDEELRKASHKALHEKYGEHQIVLGNIYKSVCKGNVAGITLRGYEGVMHTRNISEEMDSEVVDKLLDMVKSNYHLFHRHLKNKARLLGKDKVEFHDTLAPIPVVDLKDEISFEEGYELYMKCVEKFDKEFYDYSRDIFEDGRVSVFPGKGKMGGAYASYNKNKKSFVMLNHTPDFQSVMTLAHELGHAIHGWLSQVQPESVYHSPLSLAETASIFNETFVFEEIMKTISDKDKEYYIMRNLDDIFSTMVRQVMYVDFERECHQRTLDGEELSYDDFNEIWLRKSQEYYGPDVELPDYVKYGWSIIPHIFHTKFYCYAYSFGNILSFNLYQMYKDAENKEEFVEMYKNILRAGGSKRPKDLLAENGIDITSSEFYNRAFAVVEGLIKMVE